MARYPFPFVLLCLTVSISSQDAASCNIRGLPPKLCPEYTPSTNRLSCGDATGKEISLSQINDDYCDCPTTGVDEPGTSACSVGHFYCRNKGHRPKKIFSSRVNDGICDCCDGSDEWAVEPSLCPNRCAEARAEAMAEHVEKLAALKDGLKIKSQMASAGTTMLSDKQRKLSEISTSLSQKRSVLEAARAKKDDLETKEREHREKLKKEAEEEAAKKREEEIRDELSGDVQVDGEVVVESATTEEGEQAEGSTTGEQQQQPKEEEKADDGIDHKFPYPKEYRPPEEEESHEKEKSEIEKSEEAEEMNFPYPDEYKPHDEEDDSSSQQPPPSDDPEDEIKYEDGKKFDWDQFDNEDEDEDDADLYADHNEAPAEVNVDYDSDPEMVAKTQAANEARTEFNSIDSEVRELENNERELNTFLAMNLGSQNEFASLYDECFSVDVQKYVYEFCPFKKAEQKEGGSGTSLGSFTTFDIEEDGKIEMKFENGQSCWNGPARSLKVKFKCGGENKVTTVTEPAMCTYEMTFLTPLACRESDLRELEKMLAGGDDDHEEL